MKQIKSECMRIILSTAVLAGIVNTASALPGGYYLGASQINIEGGYSGERLNFGLGVRAFAYDINRPSRFSSNGDLELTGYYFQKRFGISKFQFGHSYHGSFVYDKYGDRFDYGSAIGLVKTGVEAVFGSSFGVYWDCIPVYISNFNLFEMDSQDFNRISIGTQSQKIGIRLYL